MLASINPLVERGRNQRWGVTVTAYLAGSALGGVVLGGGLATLGALLGPKVSLAAALAALAVLGALGLVLELRLVDVRLPGPRRQVNENWLVTYRGWVYGAGFGFQLGFGVATIVTTSLTYLAFACALLAGSPWGGVVVGAVFGIARALPIFVTAGVDEPDALRSVVRRVQSWLPGWQRLVVGTEVMAVVGAAAGALAVR